MEVLSIQSTPKVLCLGLGSPTASREARAQLAFLLEVCDDLIIVCTSRYVKTFTDTENTPVFCAIPRSIPMSPCMTPRSRTKTINFSQHWP